MKLAFSSLGCPELSLEQVAETAGRCGFGGVELRGRRGEHVDPGLEARERSRVRGLFAERAVQIIAVTAYTRFAFAAGSIRRANEEELLAYAELAADLGAPFVRTFIGTWAQDLQPQAVHQAAAESLKRVAAAVADLPVTVLVETHDSTSRVQDLAPILSRVASPKVGVLWDMAHSFSGGEPLERSLELIGGRLGYLHLKDEKRAPDGGIRHCLPGEGDLPLRECRRLLQARGFQGWCCLEWERKWHPELPPLHQALERFRALMTDRPQGR